MFWFKKNRNYLILSGEIKRTVKMIEKSRLIGLLFFFIFGCQSPKNLKEKKRSF
jgi:hypothetical protein